MREQKTRTKRRTKTRAAVTVPGARREPRC
jgi:hypothetical protein